MSSPQITRLKTALKAIAGVPCHMEYNAPFFQIYALDGADISRRGILRMIRHNCRTLGWQVDFSEPPAVHRPDFPSSFVIDAVFQRSFKPRQAAAKRRPLAPAHERTTQLDLFGTEGASRHD